MKFKTRLATLALASLPTLTACGDDDDNNNNNTEVCSGVDCGPHGTCIVVGDQAACDCVSGYRPEGLTCVRDNIPPDITNLPVIRETSIGESMSYDVDATDVNTEDTLTWEISSTTCSFTSDIDAATGVVSWTCGDEESCAVYVMVTDDGDPPRHDEGSLFINCIEGLPVFDSAPQMIAHEHQPYQYSIGCHDPFGQSLTLGVATSDTCSGALTDNGDGSGSYSFTPDEQQGGTSCVVGVVCSNPTLSATQMGIVSIGEVNAVPIITNLPATAASHWDTANSYIVSANDAADDPTNTISYLINGNTCSFTPTINAGGLVEWTCSGVESCTVTVLVFDDGAPPESVTGQLSVACTNSLPVITSTAPVNAFEEMAYTYNVACSDADGDTLGLSVGTGDTCGGDLTDDGDGTGSYTFTPAAGSAGTSCNVQITCTDTQHVDSQDTLVTIIGST